MVLLIMVGGIGIAFLLLRPEPNEALFWCIVVPGVAANMAYVILSRQIDSRYQNETDRWLDEIRELVGEDELLSTLERDPHFADYGKGERNHILVALRFQPEANRTLESILVDTALDLRKSCN